MQAMVPMILEYPGMIFGLEKGWSSTISKNYVLRFQKLYARIRKSVEDKSPKQCKFQICDSWISTSCTYTQEKKMTLHLPARNPPPTLTNRMTFLHLFNPQPRMKNNTGPCIYTWTISHVNHVFEKDGYTIAMTKVVDLPSLMPLVEWLAMVFNCLAWPSSKTMAHSIGSFGLNPLTNTTFETFGWCLFLLGFGQYSITLSFGR